MKLAILPEREGGGAVKANSPFFEVVFGSKSLLLHSIMVQADRGR